MTDTTALEQELVAALLARRIAARTLRAARQRVRLAACAVEAARAGAVPVPPSVVTP